MTQENKELLIKDLCARLPYGVKVEIARINWYSYEEEVVVRNIKSIFPSIYAVTTTNTTYPIRDVKPYLFPMSSMTEEQKYTCPIGVGELEIFIENANWNIMQITPDSIIPFFDWLHKNHFDYRGLIPKGLSIDATNLNIY